MDASTIHLIRKTAKLLAKAGATDSEREAVALVEMSSHLLRQVMIAIERDETALDPAGQRRERRHIFDRRRSRISESARPAVGEVVDPFVAIARYQRTPDETRGTGGTIDRTI